MQDHRKLEIWRLSCDLAVDVRAAVNRFPRRGFAELKEQIVSAAESIAETIVEGCGADSQKEFARFLSMSIKSNRELEGELEMAYGYHILTEERWRALTNFTVLIRKKTYTLRTRVLASVRQGSSRRRNAKKPRSERGTERNANPEANPNVDLNPRRRAESPRPAQSPRRTELKTRTPNPERPTVNPKPPGQRNSSQGR
jgi:four helix bundle protein